MPAKDELRWTQNDDGSWTRQVGEVEETTAVNPYATQGALDVAEALGVDINSVVGSGKEGKITKADVEAAAGGDD